MCIEDFAADLKAAVQECEEAGLFPAALACEFLDDCNEDTTLDYDDCSGGLFSAPDDYPW